MAYWVVFRSASGVLVCRGDTVEPVNLRPGVEAKSFVSKPADTKEWDPATRDFVDMTIVPPVDSIALISADISADPALSTLTAPQRTRIEEIVDARLGRQRFNG